MDLNWWNTGRACARLALRVTMHPAPSFVSFPRIRIHLSENDVQHLYLFNKHDNERQKLKMAREKEFYVGTKADQVQ